MLTVTHDIGPVGGELEEVTQDGRLAGFVWRHTALTPHGVGPCVGGFFLHGYGQGAATGRHAVLFDAPDLTIVPSLLCPSCGLHGFVNAGRWVGA